MFRSPPISTLIFLVLSHFTLLISATDSASNTVESVFDSANGYRIGGSILAITAMAVGVLMIVSGYRFLHATLFATGFVLGGVAVAIAVENVFEDESWVVLASWIAFVVSGLIIGSIATSLYSLGIFVAGAAAGIVLAIMINNSVGYEIYPSNPQVVLIVLCIGLGLIGGILAIKLEKPVLITATSLFGAAILVWGVGYFAGDFPSSNDLERYRTLDANNNWVYAIPNAWWGYLVSIVVVFFLGLFVQSRKTVRGGVYYLSRAMGRGTDDVQYMEAGTPQKQYGNTVNHV